MWLLIKTAWRNLFRQKRRTLITVSAMALSLWMAIPTWGLTEGLTREMLRGITGMELGDVQVHDPAYPKGKALQSTLDHPKRLLATLAATPGVRAAAPRVRGYALGSHDEPLRVRLVALPSASAARPIGFGRAVNPKHPWRTDRARACEALTSSAVAHAHHLQVGVVLTPTPPGREGRCERIQVVGITRSAPGAAPDTAPSPGASLFLPAEDLRAAFGSTAHATRAIIRHSAPLLLVGVDPARERRVTFMAEKVRKGRYLAQTPAREIVVGYRLAKTMHLKVGQKIFVQAAALDATQGTFYQDFRVVGIYRTGVDIVDRLQVFLHIRDAQRLMTLGDRIHEIAVKGTDARKTAPLVRRIRARLKTRLAVVTAPTGKRAGSRPLPAPVTVYEPNDGGAVLITPYDLERRFFDLPGVAAVSRRVYGRVSVARARSVRMTVLRRPASPLGALGAKAPLDRCTLYLQPATARALGLTEKNGLVAPDAADGDENGCVEVKVVILPAGPIAALSPPIAKAESSVAKGAAPRGRPATAAAHGVAPRAPTAPGAAPRPAAPLAYALLPKPTGGDDDEEPPAVRAGLQTFLVPLRPSGLRFVGVETAREKALSGLPARVGAGAYLDEKVAGVRSSWPVLLAPGAAKRLGAKPASSILLRVQPREGPARWRLGHVTGILSPARWPSGLPALVLPYYQAQQIHARRLNARAHELLLLPKPKAKPKAIAETARARLKPLVRAWQTIAPDMAKLVQMQDMWTGIMLFIIFAIAAMTVMNTMLMAVWERTREFGVLKSIGMRPAQVFGLIVIETVFLALIAMVVGGGGGILLNYWAVVAGIDLSAWTGGFTYQGTFIDPVWRAAFSTKVVLGPIVMVEIVCLLVSIYPAFRAGRLKPVQALRHVG